MTKEEVLGLCACECGEKTIAEAITIFQNTSEPFRKAKKEVTGCSKTCCKDLLQKLFDMTYFGKFDYDEIAYQVELKNDKAKKLLDALKN